MVVDEQEPSGDEQADFADMLSKFKQGVAENVDAEDYQSHYDLAIAFKEMGCSTRRSPSSRKRWAVRPIVCRRTRRSASAFSRRTIQAGGVDSRSRAERAWRPEEQLVGVLYLLGRANEAQGKTEDALAYYQRVFVRHPVPRHRRSDQRPREGGR